MSALTAPIRLADHTPHVPLTITNIVVSVKVADALDLDDLARTIPGADYDKRRFPGLVYRRTSPKFSAIVFTSGKANLTGLPNPDSIAPALAALLAALRTAGVTLDTDPQPRIVNLVTTGNLGTGVSLVRLTSALDLAKIEYEPETFPGLVYRSAAGGTALVFGSGAVVVTGTRSLDAAKAAADELRILVDTAGGWVRT